MDEIQITVNKFRTAEVGVEPRRRTRNSKVARLIEEARDTLKIFPDGEAIFRNQCRGSWLNHECRNSDLEFRYRHVPGTGSSRWSFDPATQEYKTHRVALRHDVYVARKAVAAEEDRPAVVEACRNMTGFLGGVR
jgi:hypothetical protein